MRTIELEAQKARAREIRLGDLLTPKALWNQTEGKRSRRMPSRVEVVAVGPYLGSSQTGIRVVVETLTGAEIGLDAGWFEEVEEAGKLALLTAEDSRP